MRIITEPSTPAPHTRTVSVELTGLEVAIIRQALGRTDSTVFNPLAEELDIDSDHVAQVDTELFMTFGDAARSMEVPS